MLSTWGILVVAFAYLCLLFAIAYYADKRADAGRSVIRSPWIYALSIAVFCTSWTFYGSVGRAASGGIHFLPIYLGPTLVFLLWWFVIRKIIRISKAHRITSIADFISSRYGKSTSLGALVTVIAVIGIIPYISLQLKAVSTSFNVLRQYPVVAMPLQTNVPLLADTAFWVALVMAVFAILFGTRHIDASEHHEGMVAAVAFESLVKLIAFLAVGIFVTFGVNDGFGDLFSRAAADEAIVQIFFIDSGGSYLQWITLTLLSMAAIICLPRQFQVTVVENVNERHLARAVWLFPLYMLVINIFVLPIAVSGLLQFPAGTVDADTFVLTIPMQERAEGLAMLAFIGGLSAATGMVIVAAIALSTMICNDLIMPALIRISWLRMTERGDLSTPAAAYSPRRHHPDSAAVLRCTSVSSASPRRWSPSAWCPSRPPPSSPRRSSAASSGRAGHALGALVGLTLGFVIWSYTLLLPSFARPGWLPISFIEYGPLGIELLRPYALFGLQGLDSLSHAMFWSMLANIGGYVMVSLLDRPSAIERIQAVLFVDVFRHSGAQSGSRFWRGSATVPDLKNLVARFIGPIRADRAFADYGRIHDVNVGKLREADPGLVSYAERLLAGVIGAASSRVMVASVAKGEVLGIEEVLEILEETSQVIEYSHGLEQKSRELEALAAELREANARLQELDHMKDEFLSTVSHELRTPLTSIRSFSEILFDNPDIGVDDRRKFLAVIVKESERLTRLINQILDLAKMEAGSLDWEMESLAPREVIEEAIAITSALFTEKAARLEVRMDHDLPTVFADRDRLIQVLVNLLSNAVKFCADKAGYVVVTARRRPEGLQISVADNGRGIPAENRQLIFEKFQQAASNLTDKPRGTGLGLTISRQIVEHFGGSIWVEAAPGGGACFCVMLPRRKQVAVPRAV
jgi:signal transduction histidine kinase/Na+/proline symporter